MDWVGTVPPVSMKLDPNVVTKVNANPYIDKTYRAPFTKQALVHTIQALIVNVFLWTFVLSTIFTIRGFGIENYTEEWLIFGSIMSTFTGFGLIMMYIFWIQDAISELKWDWNVLHKFGYYRHWHLKFAETDYDRMRRENKAVRPEEEEWRGMDD